MSQENVEVLERFTEAFNRRSLDSLRKMVQSDATFASPGGTLHGHDGLAAWTKQWWEKELVVSIEIEQLIDVEDAVVALVVLKTEGRESHEAAESFHVAAVFDFRNGKVSNWTPYPGRARALEAVGLRE